jgi:hypothetical protein
MREVMVEIVPPHASLINDNRAESPTGVTLAVH